MNNGGKTSPPFRQPIWVTSITKPQDGPMASEGLANIDDSFV